ncbi:hypothetical protein DVR12_08205 [Chitinophaga silvatica]|uniref:Gingipain domain-containing protein n=1 Tax=Chitinophaga silvatica TaxID=2282649 RepID=A0A3E1YC47_9BACT|nr:type IX secretion system sortase PorU [Chitinophaga silvatica]RFS23862.1 hypothetical protein DVR12_08205 [Chitinophaga silvatica]
MKLKHIFICLLLFSKYSANLFAQGKREYKERSVLSSGSWFQLAIGQPGIYKLDLSLLQRMGVGGTPIPINQIHLHGSGGAMMGEETSASYTDDLPEVALWAVDDGDGILNGNDYLLFYAPGPHRWKVDNTGNFYHEQHLYSDSSYYYLNIGGANGLRIRSQVSPGLPVITETSFDFHAWYERDSINFLSTGKQWWGQEFSNVVGLSRNYNFSLPGTPVEPVRLKMRVAGKSIGGCNFNAAVNQASAINNLYLLPVTDNVFEGVASASTGEGSAKVNSSQINVQVSLQPDNINDKGWLDYLEVQVRCPLTMPDGILDFRSRAVVNKTLVRFGLNKAPDQLQIWDVTNPMAPEEMLLSRKVDSVFFTSPGDTTREYLAFRISDVRQPAYNGIVPNQNLHGQHTVDMLIITYGLFKAQAERLAAFHREKDQLAVNVVTTQEVYNEFGSGTPDLVAIRNYVKMFADRGKAPKYLLLFGAASYDYKNRVKNNTNLVPSWQSFASLDGLRSYVSDDFFGILAPGGDINRTDKADTLETGIGRIPATNANEATIAVNKIIRYYEPAALGKWRNDVMIIADDEDNNLHFNDAERLAEVIAEAAPVFNLNKIYVDAYPQVIKSGISTAPEVNSAINKGINQGALILNYTGHGSSMRLAAESIIDANSLSSWQNKNKLPLFITATCDFAPFDDPGITSLGHKILFMPEGGSIALMTTTRAVVAASNRIINENYFKAALIREEQGMPTLGTAAMLAKNLTYRQSNDFINNRKFQLLGDPALRLGYPTFRIVTDSVNGLPGIDTIKGLGTYIIKGHLEKIDGSRYKDFNGKLYTTVYDQPSREQTRGNDAGSISVPWQQQKNILFQGTQTVANGDFSFTFVAPIDIRAGTGKGKFSYYATNEQIDGAGYTNNFTTGGVATNIPADITGPVINAWLDSRRFKNNDIVGRSPLLIIDLADSSGINISGNDPAHLVTALLDGTEYIVLNDYFEAYLDNFRKNSIYYPLSRLETGTHNITIQAWDNYNNKSTTTIAFTVSEEGILAVEQVRNYPNPVQGATRFTFIHNQQDEELDLTLQIFTIEGRLVKTMHDTIISTNGRYDGMPWDGRSDSGAKLSSGLYVYRLAIKTSKGTKVKGGKLVLL